MVLYDFKYPDLASIAYREFLKSKRKQYSFHMLNLSQVEYSRRINPLKREYIPSLSAATETAEALIEALRKSERSHGADQFFSQSAINFLAAIIYFFSKAQGGKYSTLPHVLAFVNHSYQDIFSTLYEEPELHSLLAPFKSAYDQKAFDQLEGQIGTLRINLARLATKETYWVFSGDDFPLRVSDPDHPSILVMANDPQTQQINSACFSVVINRLTRLLNQKGNLPCSMILDEAPTVYVHKVENLLATARSNRISVLLGLQELPQLRQQYGREVAETICAVAGNILSGAVRNRDTLLWLEKLFGKVRQVRNGISVDHYRTSLSQNEYMDNLIPASRIANLSTGELVGQVATESRGYAHHMYHCRVKARYDLERYAQTTLPQYYDFGKDREAVLNGNMEKIRSEVRGVITETAGKATSIQ
jgi:type IV secretory pathway TraG/TraD family ATPase VirD4